MNFVPITKASSRAEISANNVPAITIGIDLLSSLFALFFAIVKNQVLSILKQILDCVLIIT